MARPLRILLAGVWYHVTARGNRREALYYDDTDRRWFLGLAAELPERFGIEVHAFALMDNHYHLLLHNVTVTIELHYLRCFVNLRAE